MKTSIAALSIFFFISCSDSNENKTQPANSSVPAPAVQIPANTGDTGLQKNDAGVALNPQHGQPGHRCDIAVGAPLNTPAANVVSQPDVSVSVPPVNSANASAATTVLPNTNASSNLNPQHGQPGHRCDIAVGAPLDSKPKQ